MNDEKCSDLLFSSSATFSSSSTEQPYIAHARAEPSRRGKTQTWRWTKVLQIRLYDEDSVEHPVYFTDTGEAVGLTPEEAKKKMKLIYKSRQT